MLKIFRTKDFEFGNTRVLSLLINVLTIKKIEESNEKRRENDRKKPCVLRHIGC